MIIINIRFKLIVTKKLFSDHSYINDGRHVTKRKFPLLHVGYTVWCRGIFICDIHSQYSFGTQWNLTWSLSQLLNRCTNCLSVYSECQDFVFWCRKKRSTEINIRWRQLWDCFLINWEWSTADFSRRNFNPNHNCMENTQWQTWDAQRDVILRTHDSKWQPDASACG